MKKIINKIINGEVLNLKNHILASNPYEATKEFDLVLRNPERHLMTSENGEIKIHKINNMLIFDCSDYLPNGASHSQYSKRLVFIKK